MQLNIYSYDSKIYMYIINTVVVTDSEEFIK